MNSDINALTVVVAGLGPMGRGIARVFRSAGAEVIVSDLTPELTAAGVATIAEESAAAGNPVTVLGAPLEEAVARADLFVEAIVENMAAKQSLLSIVKQHARPELIVASNTSSLSIGEMGSLFGEPERVIGMHFFNPPTSMKLVEVIVGPGTDPATVDFIERVSADIGKTVVRCSDSPNFVVNRVCRPLYYESQLLVMQGMAPEAVDAIAMQALGYPLGPLGLSDLVGLHTHLASSETAHREFGDPRYRPIPNVRALVRSGMTGRAAGRGFYNYGQEKPRDAIARVTVPAPTASATASNTVAWAGPDSARMRETFPAPGSSDPAVTVYSCHRSPTEAELDEVRELALTGLVVVDSSDGAWLDVLPAGVEWARVHVRNEVRFAEVVDDEIAGIHPGRGVDALLAAIGAQSVRVLALPGLVADRIANCVANEAYAVVEEGTAAPDDVDVALRLGMNHARGPFEYVRDAGESAVYAGLVSMQRDSGDPRYRPAALLRRTVAGERRNHEH